MSRPTMEHQLKTWPRWFQATEDCLKSFEVRSFDRDFRAGDDLLLLEWDPKAKEYTGRSLSMVVLAVYTDLPGLEEGYCILEVCRNWDEQVGDFEAEESEMEAPEEPTI